MSAKERRKNRPKNRDHNFLRKDADDEVGNAITIFRQGHLKLRQPDDSLIDAGTGGGGASSFEDLDDVNAAGKDDRFAVLYDEGASEYIVDAIELADVVGLVSALAGKAASSHTHAQSDITGLVTALGTKVDTSGNSGTGAAVLKTVSGTTLTARKQKAGTHMTVTENTDDVTYDGDGDAESIQGIPVSASPPDDGAVATYDAGSSQIIWADAGTIQTTEGAFVGSRTVYATALFDEAPTEDWPYTVNATATFDESAEMDTYTANATATFGAGG